MNDSPDPTIDSDRDGPKSRSNTPRQGVSPEWQAVLSESETGLRAFLRGRLRQNADVDDCYQAVLLAVFRSGSGVAPSARRSWLFRVAANEAALFWRRSATNDRVLEQQAEYQTDADRHTPDQKLTRDETIEQIRTAMDDLPDDWQRVIRMRLDQDLTFREIAQQLNIPIGTALTWMRRGIERIQKQLQDEN